MVPTVRRSGSKYSADFESCLTRAYLALVVSSAARAEPPDLVELPGEPWNSTPLVDGRRVLDAVTQGLAEVRSRTGADIHLSAIEFVPQDTPDYGLYRHLAIKIGMVVAKG